MITPVKSSLISSPETLLLSLKDSFFTHDMSSYDGYVPTVYVFSRYNGTNHLAWSTRTPFLLATPMKEIATLKKSQL